MRGEIEARHDERIKAIEYRVTALEEDSVTRHEFDPIKTFVYGAICFLISSLLLALCTIISQRLWPPTSVLS